MRVSLPRTKKGRSITVATVAALVVVPSVALMIPAQATIAPGTAMPVAKISLTHPKIGKISQAKLLRTSDLPRGYKRINEGPLVKKLTGHSGELKSLKGQISISPQSCVDFVKGQIPNGAGGFQAQAHRAWKFGTSQFGPYTGEGIGRFDTADQAHAAVGNAQSIADSCSNVTATTPYGPATITVTASASNINGAEEANTYSINASLGGFFNASGTVVVARAGNKVVVVGNGGMTPSSTTDVQALTATAVGRL